MHWLSMYSYCINHGLYYCYLDIFVFPLHDCFPLLILISPLLNMWAVDMRCVESHIYCSRFPLSCFMLSTELRSCYHVTCTMHCTCSCYVVYFKWNIIKITWGWGRLDGWLDLIGWCTGSILLVPLQGTVVLPTNSSMSSRYLIRAPLLAEGPGLSSQGFV